MFHNNIKKEMNNNKTKHSPPPLPPKRSHTENKEVKDICIFLNEPTFNIQMVI